ncbi:MAG: lipoprotein-releasing system ATP-binding protein [Planctomycetota bacterium]|jgi:lipoprotein-releasing system ATP-binding protein
MSNLEHMPTSNPETESGEQGELVYSVRGLSKSFTLPSGEKLQVLKGANLEVRREEFLLIKGQSGIGKSTFLHILGLLDRADGGQLLLDGVDVQKLSRKARARTRAEKIGFVFQFYHLLPEFTALENIMVPGKIEFGPIAWMKNRAQAKERAEYLLNLVGISERADHRPNQLSGGERQRVALARALFNQPSIMLCDEPTGNLDVKTSDAIHELIAKLAAETGQTMIVVTHDPSLEAYASKVLSLTDGGFVEHKISGGRAEDETLFDSPAGDVTVQ